MTGTSPFAGRVRLQISGGYFDRWSTVEIHRDLKEIGGSFTLDYIDDARIAQADPVVLGQMPFFGIIKAGLACTVSLDGQVVLTGWIDDVDVNWEGTSFSARLTGRDKTGDLADCAAAPNGPAEYAGLTLTQIATAIGKPFGITVRAEIDVGAPFPRVAINPHEHALALLEKLARQRAALLVSDGVGGLLITRGGTTQAPAPLTRPGNITGGAAQQSWRQRYSDYYVKGQTDGRARRHGIAAPLTPATMPTGDDATPPASATTTEKSTIVMTGHATDPEITRYRPVVRQVRTQSGAASAQQQAEWMLRVSRGESSNLTYRVLDWRAGQQGALWLPNQQVHVTDPYATIDETMLIAGCTYTANDRAVQTSLRVTGLTAYDLIDQPAPRRKGATRNKVTAGGLGRA